VHSEAVARRIVEKQGKEIEPYDLPEPPTQFEEQVG
jgi:hypothetical protein